MQIRYTERARKVMELASQEASRLGHVLAGPEHLLWALLREACGVAVRLLKSVQVDLEKVGLTLELMLATTAGPTDPGSGKRMLRYQRVVEYALDEARALGHEYVGTEHLLLGILREAEYWYLDLDLKQHEIRDALLLLREGGAVEWQSLSPLTADAQLVLQAATRVVRELNHGSLSTGHVLLALVQDAESVPGRVLRGLAATPEAIRHELRALVVETAPWPESKVPHTSGLTQSLKGAVEEARALSPTRELEEELIRLEAEKERAVERQQFEHAAKLRDRICKLEAKLPAETWAVEPAHLLLGLLRDPQCLAVRIIQNLGLHPEQVRSEVLQRLGDPAR